ncbi:nitrite reductase small subunit NirD [Verrucomicrobiaceae bacterium R5-34]|uniref:Nitrite reductase small subunit NirD n=1 Tax=Oceaniferula flava TaxID=2800421 RepID=A0AAE2SC60_9BACT|nr:nitrite reductase small subunit NirD [Oceaniferula flavus]MBK1831314.1 nitrite reductase small subunit NirD [Verrucomicrobiaceae bacterium R5-34]MBK1855485.1 nitrite reductase small subunit NirD [Oceaniferula flavus]MBM1136791.1 nitrite reductase small subunit NirD [Oceaniferula flavus]
MITDTKWTSLGSIDNFPLHLGTCVKVGDTQIAVFHLPTEGKWYAVQNLNPINERMVLSRGMVGDENGVPYVACPLHKHHFALETGMCLNDPTYTIQTFPIKEEGGELIIAA